MMGFWNIRSRWDYLAFTALFQWVFFGLAILAGIVGQALGGAFMEAAVLFLIAVGFNFISGPTVLLAVHFGSRSHEHIGPGILFKIIAFFFAPVMGVYYLYLTGNA